MRRRVGGEAQSVEGQGRREQAHFRPLPVVDYPACTCHSVKANPYSQVVFETNRYSVPVLHVGAPATIRLHRERVRIWRDTTCIADHPRAPDGAHQRVIDPAHFAPLFAKKPRAQAMLYREVLLALGGVAPTFLSALSQRHRARLTDELVAVYALYERHGATDLLAAMAHAERARAGHLELANIGADAAADVEHDRMGERREVADHVEAAVLAEAPHETRIAARDGGFVVHELIIKQSRGESATRPYALMG